ncbi:MAG: hypothetical protein HY316_01870 [Acidobacteria bacterium]|nr:hypothetical protein [Acidobacteriota bacterium]
MRDCPEIKIAKIGNLPDVPPAGGWPPHKPIRMEEDLWALRIAGRDKNGPRRRARIPGGVAHAVNGRVDAPVTFRRALRAQLKRAIVSVQRGPLNVVGGVAVALPIIRFIAPQREQYDVRAGIAGVVEQEQSRNGDQQIPRRQVPRDDSFSKGVIPNEVRDLLLFVPRCVPQVSFRPR